MLKVMSTYSKSWEQHGDGRTKYTDIVPFKNILYCFNRETAFVEIQQSLLAF